MGKFSDYGKKVSKLAKEAFGDYQKAEADLKKAEADLRKAEKEAKGWRVDEETTRNHILARARHEEAKRGLKAAKNMLEHRKADIAALRGKLEEDVANFYSAKPSAVDIKTLELLKSGILAPSEYARLSRQARAAENYTMARMIGNYAEKALDGVCKEYGNSSPQAQEMRLAVVGAHQDGADNALEAFDMLAKTYNMSINNPAMMDEWDGLTGPVVENM